MTTDVKAGLPTASQQTQQDSTIPAEVLKQSSKLAIEDKDIL
jgi:hypothetical protein